MVPNKNSLENCILEVNHHDFDAKNMFDNDWNINGWTINSGLHTKDPGQAWVATDLGKTYYLQMAYFQGRSTDGDFVGRMNGVKVHFCLEFSKAKRDQNQLV